MAMTTHTPSPLPRTTIVRPPSTTTAHANNNDNSTSPAQWMDSDDLAHPSLCHVVQMVMTHVVVTVHINPGEQYLTPLPVSFFHTRSRGHVTTGDMATDNEWLTTSRWAEWIPFPSPFLTQEAGATLLSATRQKWRRTASQNLPPPSTTAHERQRAPANGNRWRRAKVSKVTSPHHWSLSHAIQVPHRQQRRGNQMTGDDRDMSFVVVL